MLVSLVGTDALNTLAIIRSAPEKISKPGQFAKMYFRRLPMKFIKKLFHDVDGATAIEYGLIAALISIAAIAAMDGLGNQLSTTFNTTSSAMADT